MKCEDVRTVTLRALAGDATAEETAAARAHVKGCVECRADAADTEAVWRMLDAWDVPAPPVDAETRLRGTIDARERAGTAAQRMRRYWPAVAAAIAGLLIGFALPRPTGPPTAAASDQPAYLLLLRRGPDAASPTTGPTFETMVAEYSAWRDGLAERGVLLASNLLDATAGVELRGGPSGVAVTDSVPRSTAGEYVSGYYLIAAPDLASARQLARTSPHLRYGGSIELRPVSTPPSPEAR